MADDIIAVDWHYIANRHALGERKARQRISEIKSLLPDGGDAKAGRVMLYEVLAWEQYRAEKAMKGPKQ